MCRVHACGVTYLVVVQGDLLIVDTGDKVIADGVLVHGHGLVVDEASLTGESDPQNKSPEKPWLRAGTQVLRCCVCAVKAPVAMLLVCSVQQFQWCRQVVEGDGRMLVIAVGEDSEWGRTMAMVVGETPDTPLQEKLTDLAAAISKVGLAVAVLAFVVLMIRWALHLWLASLHTLSRPQKGDTR